jgi:hypothetical protein
MEQLVILVIIGLISLVNWLIQRSAEARERRRIERKRQESPDGDPFHQDGTARKVEQPEPVSDADPAREMRRLMEAFGIPMEPEDPAPPEKIRPVAPPALPTPPAWVPASPRPAAVRAEAVPPILPTAVRRRSAAPISSLLRTRKAARQAVVLREILGPPKAFQ